jgi:MGT family glycosyltransferase
MICRDAPEALQKLGIEAVLVDQGEPAGATVVEYLNLPFITISCAIAGNREPSVPPSIMPWSYQTAWWAILRNQFGYFLFDWFTQPIAKVVARYRRQWQLTPYQNFDASFSPLAQICQQTADFDFPRQHLPSCFHYIGGLFPSSSSQQIAFPFEQLDGRPLIYASMGTLQNRLLWIFPIIAEACVGLDAQLVISLGGGASPESLPELPGNPIVVGYAPQLELLQRATLTITHSGLNTVLESLRYGVPMVAIPITNDQPGTAARIQFTGVGEAIMLKQLTVSTLHKTIKKVMEENSYRDKANQLQESISQAGGVVRAADIIEQAVATRKPVLAV